MLRLIPLLLVISLLLISCTVGPNYHPPQINVNPAFGELKPATNPATQPSQAMDAAPIVEWWTTFRDPALDSLIDRAIKNNLDLKQAEARVREARAQRAVDVAGEYPDVNLTGQGEKLRISKNGFPIPGAAGPTPSNNTASPMAARPSAAAGAPPGGAASALFSKSEFDLYQVGFDASWELDVFGGVRRAVEAANADVAASVEDRRDVLVTLLAEVARNYIELRAFQYRLQIAEENLKAQQDTLSITQAKANVGLTTSLDVTRAAAEVATTASQIPPLTSDVRQSIHALGVLLGQDPMALTDELSIKGAIPPPPPQVPIGLPAELLRRRPDVRRAERQLAAATARVGVATADLYPRFSLTGSFAMQSLKPKNLFDWSSRTFNIGPAVSWPVFDAGRIRASINVQNARQEQALAAYERSVLSALKDVENALTAYSTEQLRRKALEDAVSANRTAVELATDQYNRGVADFLTVLDAQRNLFASQDQLAQSQRTISTDLVALYKALGGGWEIEQQR